MVKENHTPFLINWLNQNSQLMGRYLDSCRARGVLPNCSDFLKVSGLDWSKFQYSRKEITAYLRRWYAALR